jgi:hypothetical protein
MSCLHKIFFSLLLDFSILSPMCLLLGGMGKEAEDDDKKKKGEGKI